MDWVVGRGLFRTPWYPIRDPATGQSLSKSIGIINPKSYGVAISNFLIIAEVPSERNGGLLKPNRTTLVAWTEYHIIVSER